MRSEALYILEVCCQNETVTAQHFAPSAWRRESMGNACFSVAMMLDAASGADADVAFSCDFLAIAPSATVEVRYPSMLGRRAGRALSAADTIERLPAARLFELGIATFLLEPNVETIEGRVLRQADTMLALAQARRVSPPNRLYLE